MRYLPLFAAIFAITPLAIDLYLPAMLAIADDLNTDIQSIQFSLSLYLAGYAFGMFVFGPLADRLGRRPLLLFGLFGFSLVTFLLSRTQSIEWFLGLRFLQAFLGGSATVVIPGAIRHLFGKDTAKGFSYVAMIMMIAPMLAPAIGSHLMDLGGWRWIFITLTGYSALMLLVSFFKFPDLEATLEAGSLSKRGFWSSYKLVLGEPKIRFWLVASMLASVIFFAYITNVSFLYMERFGFSEKAFSYLFGLNVVGLILGSLINTRLVPKLGSAKILSIATLLIVALAGLLFLSVQFELGTGAFIFILMLITATCMLITANADALILLHFKSQSGTATAVIGTLRFGCGALAGPALVSFHTGTELPFVLLVFSASLVIAISIQFGRIKQNRDSRAIA